MNNEKNPNMVLSVKVTVFYFILGLLFLIFMSTSEKTFFGSWILGLSFLLLSSLIFFFAIGLFLKKEDRVSGTENEKYIKYKEMYDAAYQDKINAEIMNAAKSQFLSNMSQEIRIPMSGIIGMTELIMLTNLTKEQKEYVDIINFSSSTLLAIINDILDFSRIESGKLKLENIEFSIKELINKTSQILDFEARRKKLTLKVDISPNIDYNIFGDPLRINQILINLTKNAVKYTEAGSVSISLFEKSRTEDTAVLRFVVNDTGVGFTPDKVESLFGLPDSEGKVKLTKDFEYTGVGFGIPIVRHLITLMGGELFVNTKTGKGSTITIDIPFNTTTEKVIIPPEPVIMKKQFTEEKQKDKKEVNILIAEDNIVNQRLVKELLIRKHYDVTIVENGLKIFDVLENKKFDIILMDIQMPIMDGLEATSIIREIEKGTGKHIPIIGITAYAVKADKDKCLSAGMDDYMSKPFVKEEFYRMIEKYLQ
ncbi:MAG TPA: response regulator [Ignavibacteria bacterium]|nr:response regulator [Ignavibacteria bacterium]